MISFILVFIAGAATGIALTLWWAWPTEEVYEFTFEEQDGDIVKFGDITMRKVPNPLRTPDWEPMAPYEDDSE